MPAPVYVLYREGEDKPVEGQLDIIDTLPGEKGYNDFRQVWKVTVPKDYVANTIADAGALKDAGYKMEPTPTLRNMPVVPDKSTAKMRLKGESAELQRAWYQGQVAKFFSFDEAPLSGSGVPLSPIYVTFNVNPDQPNGGPGSGFKSEPGSEQTHNVPATLPGDAGYSPLVAGGGLRQRRFPGGARSRNGAQGQGARCGSGDGQLPDRLHRALEKKGRRISLRRPKAGHYQGVGGSPTLRGDLPDRAHAGGCHSAGGRQTTAHRNGVLSPDGERGTAPPSARPCRAAQASASS